MGRPSNLSKLAEGKPDIIKLISAGDFEGAQAALLVDTVRRLDACESARDAAPLLRIATGLLTEVAEAQEAREAAEAAAEADNGD